MLSHFPYWWLYNAPAKSLAPASLSPFSVSIKSNYLLTLKFQPSLFWECFLQVILRVRGKKHLSFQQPLSVFSHFQVLTQRIETKLPQILSKFSNCSSKEKKVRKIFSWFCFLFFSVSDLSGGFTLLKSDFVHLSIYLLAICLFSLEKCLFRSFVYFSIWLFLSFFLFLTTELKVFFIHFGISPYLIHSL